jgi:hypothetical protein
MTFEDGFEAIEKVKMSGQKLSDIVERIEQFERRLETLPDAQVKLDALFEKTEAAAMAMSEAARDLVTQRDAFLGLAKALPSLVQVMVKDAELLLEKQHAETARATSELTQIVEAVVDQKLTSILVGLEARVTERLRDELKDTRTTIREAIEVGTRRGEVSLDEARKDIIAEMPRSLFGKRGR